MHASNLATCQHDVASTILFFFCLQSSIHALCSQNIELYSLCLKCLTRVKNHQALSKKKIQERFSKTRISITNSRVHKYTHVCINRLSLHEAPLRMCSMHIVSINFHQGIWLGLCHRLKNATLKIIAFKKLLISSQGNGFSLLQHNFDL